MASVADMSLTEKSWDCLPPGFFLGQSFLGMDWILRRGKGLVNSVKKVYTDVRRQSVNKVYTFFGTELV